MRLSVSHKIIRYNLKPTVVIFLGKLLFVQEGFLDIFKGPPSPQECFHCNIHLYKEVCFFCLRLKISKVIEFSFFREASHRYRDGFMLFNFIFKSLDGLGYFSASFLH